jgi:probable rRNA maturation factor
MHAPEVLPAMLAEAGMDLLLGDLALALETVEREAQEKAISVDDHVTHLMVHGTLHLLGHDHQDDGAADAMEALETRILAGLGVADPYACAPREAVDERS